MHGTASVSESGRGFTTEVMLSECQLAAVDLVDQ